MAFGRFGEVCSFTGRGVEQQDVDRYFLTSAGDQMTTGCYRYQFIEAVMRVAKAKFYDT